MIVATVQEESAKRSVLASFHSLSSLLPYALFISSKKVKSQSSRLEEAASKRIAMNAMIEIPTTENHSAQRVDVGSPFGKTISGSQHEFR